MSLVSFHNSQTTTNKCHWFHFKRAVKPVEQYGGQGLWCTRGKGIQCPNGEIVNSGLTSFKYFTFIIEQIKSLKKKLIALLPGQLRAPYRNATHAETKSQWSGYTWKEFPLFYTEEFDHPMGTVTH